MALLRQSQLQKQTNTFLLQQKLQLLHLMHLSQVALEDYLKNQLEENPALEESNDQNDELSFEEEYSKSEDKLSEIEDYFGDDEFPDYKTYINNSANTAIIEAPPLAYTPSFRELLKEQLREFPIALATKKIIKYLIDSLDEDGYLHTSLDELVDEYGFANETFVDKTQFQKALDILQQFEPAGIGARSLQECLLIQLKRSADKSHYKELAERIIEDYFTELSLKNYSRLEKLLHIEAEELKHVLNVISHLSPRPVFTASKDWSSLYTIIPDFLITTEDNELEISLTSNPSNSIKINDEYSKIVSNGANTKVSKKEFSYFRKKVSEAKWLLEALEQREHTFLEIVKVIAGIQKDYFLSGDKKNIKPMILEDVARITGYDVSTISRVTCNKYVQTPFGNILLKDLFSISMISTDGEVVSTEKIKQELREIVDAESKDKPYTDFELVIQLKSKGYIVARRTIAKYREALHIPHARLRKGI
jgi:RNA polymerase sigma-54 factor